MVGGMKMNRLPIGTFVKDIRDGKIYMMVGYCYGGLAVVPEKGYKGTVYHFDFEHLEVVQ